MQLIEKHVIKKTDSRFELIDRAAFASKNLYTFPSKVSQQVLKLLDKNWTSFFEALRA